ncbi:N-acetyltransferase family protein [Streptomyces sp. NPDC055089]
MTVIVRDFRPADAEDWVRVRRAALPFAVTTAEQVVFDLATAHPGKRYRMLVAEEDGEVIGTAQVGLGHESPEPGQSPPAPPVSPPSRPGTASRRPAAPAPPRAARPGAGSRCASTGLDHDLTSVVVADGEVAAFSVAETDGVDRYWSGMTGTRRAYRGRGPAKLAKNDSLHRARADGYTDAYTGNDAGNGPMPAINRWFGYELCFTEVRHVRKLG